MTPEQKAKLWVDDRQTRLPTELDCQWYLALEEAFLAGYKAGYDSGFQCGCLQRLD